MSEFSPRDLVALSEQAASLAAQILSDSRQRESSQERSQSSLMARMMNDIPGKKFTIAMADQVLRIKGPRRAAERLASLVDEYGIPNYFGIFDLLTRSIRIGA